MRLAGAALLVAAVSLAACADDEPGFEPVLELPGSPAGDIVALRADGQAVEYADRRAGQIVRLPLGEEDATPTTIATIAVGIEGEQRGLLGHTVIDGRRYAAWTEPGSLDLVVGEVTSGTVDRLVWTGTPTQSKAAGGHLENYRGRLLLGLGGLTGWAVDHGSGALVLLDPNGPAEQEPEVLSDGWNNPFAFTVTQVGEVWVADNAPDGSDLPVAERAGEPIGRGDGAGIGLIEPPPQRAPAAIVELPDGRFGVCGFLDNEMRAYLVDDNGDELIGDDGEPFVRMLERAGTIGPCQTGATVLADGSLVTASASGDGTALLLRSAS